MVACKLQDELAEIISEGRQVNDYQLIVYKYIFISELKIPLMDDFDFEINDDSFIIHLIPDDLEFSILRKLDDSFDRFELIFMPNDFGLIKLKFVLKGV